MTDIEHAARAEALAQRFHETYERLAPEHGYKTREASAKPWSEVPEQNKSLMIAVCAELLGEPEIDLSDPSTWEQPTIFFDEWGALSPEEEEIEGAEEGPACWWSESTFDRAREAAEEHAGEDGQLWHRRATAWERVDE